MASLITQADPLAQAIKTSSPWYQQAVIYELHVRAFYDSDGNGAGDFQGLIEKLDYIQELGVTALWLLPFCPSPWRDDGYDVSDFIGIHSAYGCLDDFKRFLSECKRRDLRVITELVMNHTSTEHPWFERARRSPAGSPWRDFYVWSDSHERFSDARIIFKDFETSNWTWDPVAGAYYWHRFYSHQPDLNFASPDVRKAVFDTVDFWLGLGVDGLRLDAIPYLFEREGTTCENLPETHDFLRELRSYIDARYEDRMLLAEANQWPEDAVAYFGDGDECHMAFNFPLMPRLFMATRMEDSFPIVNIVQRTPCPPPGCQWATFLRNHDELTLEMVCDEERDYMYRMYAEDTEMRINLGIRRRLAPLLANDVRRIKLMNALLFSLPGTPVIYYGDEIGMGEDLSLGDRNSVRTPMQWTPGENAGFSDADTEHLYLPVVSTGEYAHGFVNVESEIRNPNSLLWWMRHTLSVRRNCEALSCGEIEFLTHDNRHVLAFLRRHDRGDVLVVANLSRYAQPVKLPLATYAGRTPVEAFGRVPFPSIGRDAYQLSLAPYGFYWFLLPNRESDGDPDGGQQHLERVDWTDREALARLLQPHLKAGNVSRPRDTTGIELVDVLNFGEHAAVAVARVSYAAGDPELRLIPMTIESGSSSAVSRTRVIARVGSDSEDEELLCIGAASGPMSNALIDLITNDGEIDSGTGRLRGHSAPLMNTVIGDAGVCLLPATPAESQRNSSALMSNVFALKLFRRLEAGGNPDISTVRYLFEQAGFGHVAPVFGWLEYSSADGHAFDAGVLHAFVEHRTDLWRLTMEELSLYLERAATERAGCSMADSSALVQSYVEMISQLARRTAEMHRALMGADDSEFRPERFDSFTLRGTCHSMSSVAAGVRQALQARVRETGGEGLEDAAEALARLQHADEMFGRLMTVTEPGLRVRAHGDLHLGQVLHTGEDVVFIDFDGDNSRPVFERLIKTSPLVDVAGVLVSLRYAVVRASQGSTAGSLRWKQREHELEAVLECWYQRVAETFTVVYRDAVAGSPLVPSDEAEFARLLNSFLISKAVYQIGYELVHRPDWVRVALRTFLSVTEHMGEVRV